MSDPHADAGVAGAEALLGLAAGTSVRLPSLPTVSDTPAVREPPPLELPTRRPSSGPLVTTQSTQLHTEPPQQQQQQQTAVFPPTPPSLSIPLHPTTSQQQQQQPLQTPQQQPAQSQPQPQSQSQSQPQPQSQSQPQPQQLQQQQPQVPGQQSQQQPTQQISQPPHPTHYLTAHHLPPPPHQTHEIPHPAGQPPPSYLPPPPTTVSHPTRQDLPSVASLSQWAPRAPPPGADASSHYCTLPQTRSPYDPIHHAPRLTSLPSSTPLLSSHSHLHPTPTAWETPTALPPRHDYWAPPPPHHAYPYAPPPPGYYYQGYYPTAPPPPAATPPQSHVPPPTQPAVHLPPYSIPCTLSQPPPVMRAPSLALPLPGPHSASAPPAPTLRPDVPPVHDVHGLRAPLPGIDHARFTMPKDNLLMAAQNRAVLADTAVSRVPDIATAFGPALQANAERRAEAAKPRQGVVGSTPAEQSQAVPPASTVTGTARAPKVAKVEKDVVKKPRSGIFAIINETDKSPHEGPQTPSESEYEKKTAEPFPIIVPDTAMRKTNGMKAKREQEEESKAEGEIVNVERESVKAVVGTETAEKTNVDGASSKEKEEESDGKEQACHGLEERTVKGAKHMEKALSGKDESRTRAEGRKSDSDEAADDGTDVEKTVCPCGSEENSGFMIACDECNTWQHSKCMGFGKNPKAVDPYYCDRCRPEEIRPNSIAFRKYRERMLAKERLGKDSNREFDPLLAGIKPLELRKHFAADLRDKNAGRKLSKGEVFHRYATLLRSQFMKYRQSVIEGITVLLEIPRAEVVDKLDAVVKRLRTVPGDRGSEESHQKRRSAEGLHDAPHGDVSKSHTHGRGQPQKRPRPSSVSFDPADANHNHDPSRAGEVPMDVDMTPGDPSTSRTMSREERKIQQTMKLFARLEEQEREREKKKPRTGESAGSPKTGQNSRPKTPRPSPQPLTISPKGSIRHHQIDLDERKGNPLPHSEVVQETTVDTWPESEKQHKETGLQQELQPQEDQIDQQESHQPPKPSRKGIVVSNSELEPVAREQSKRERDHRNREKGDRPSLRRKEISLPDAVNNGNGRRRGILERDRSQDRKRRRTGAVTRETERRSASEREHTRRDSSLDFELFVPGRSVLGSKMIPKARLSTLERERLDKENSSAAQALKRGLPRKKHHLKTSLEEKKRAKDWDIQSPAKRRYQANEKQNGNSLRVQVVADEPTGEKNLKANANKHSTPEGVHMILISERGKLHDKGQMFETSHLIASESKDMSSCALDKNKHKGENVCLRKRTKMFSLPWKADDANGASDEDAPRVSASHLKIRIPPRSPEPRSPGASSPRSRPALASPRRVRSPMLRSSPVSGVLGLRSVAPSATRKENTTASQRSSLKFERNTPSWDSSRSPSPDRKAAGSSLVDKGYRTSNPAPSRDAFSKEQSKVEEDVLKSNALSLSKSVRARVSSPVGASKPTPNANGFGIRSIRSAPAPGLHTTEYPQGEVTPKVLKDSSKESTKSASPLPSPRRRPLTSVGITDILQQRLERCLKPSPSSHGGQSSSGAPPRGITRSQVGADSSGREGKNGPGEVNGFTPLPSFASRKLERNKPWRSSSLANRRGYGPHVSSKGSPSSTSHPTPRTRVSPSENGQKHPFRSQLDTLGRSEDTSRTGSRQPWNGYPRRNGWASGNGGPHHASSGADSRGNRGGRH